jgi:phospholipid-binding lipoprotein MlaA
VTQFPASPSTLRRASAKAALAVALATVLAGPALAQAAAPASPPAQAAPAGASIPDPWVGPNRTLYGINHAVDHAVIAPVIHGYMRVTPRFFRTGLSHAVDNLDEPRIAANDVLQLRFKRGGIAATRFIINSTFGLAGLIDVAGTSGLQRHEADFGQTLGRYGVGTGPYVFIPIAGPTDIRDGIGRIIDAFGDPLTVAFGGLGSSTFGDVRAGVTVVTARTDIDDQLRGLDRDFTDPYTTLRSAYSQQRAYLISNARGETPEAVQDLPDFGTAPAAQPAPKH